MRTFYGLADTDDIDALGEHEDFFGADEAAKRNYIWIFDAETFAKWERQVREHESAKGRA